MHLLSALLNQHKMVKFFIENGANVHLKNNNGFSPLAIACRNSHNIETVKVLIEAGALAESNGA